MLISIGIGILYGIIKKGNIYNLILGLRCIYIIIISYGIEITDKLLYNFLKFESQHMFLCLISYILFFMFIIFNIKNKLGSIICFAGGLLNFFVIALNGFNMPVREVPELSGKDLGIGYIFSNTETKLYFLGDIIKIPIPVIGGMISIGDILICIGIIFLVKDIMMKNKLPESK